MKKSSGQRGSIHSLTHEAREVAQAPQQLRSAGDELIKQLLIKQRQTDISLEEHLAVKKNFLRAGEGSGNDDTRSCSSIEELQKKTGLSRQELELALAEKPNSSTSKLFKFALSNQSASSSTDLISQLPDHPFNNLKTLEHQVSSNSNEDFQKKRKRRKRRKKPAPIEQTCEPPPHWKRAKSSPDEKLNEQDKLRNEFQDEQKVREDFGRLEQLECSQCRKVLKTCDRPENLMTPQKILENEDSATRNKSQNLEQTSEGEISCASCCKESGPRRSLWDVRDMKTMEKREVGPILPKTYTIIDGKILEVNKKCPE